MNTYLMKKAMIETAVTRGIHEMEEDPERSVRRLIDLGRQFSKNRFQDQIFSVMQKSLTNENSAYYDMVHNLMKNSDHAAMKEFGVNFGYMGWTYGAARIRETEKKEGVCIPWCIMLRYDPAGRNGYSMEQLAHLFEQGQDLGIYVYFIRERGTGDSYELLELLERYKDCAFVWVKEDGRLTAAQIQVLRACRNTLVMLPADTENTEPLLTAALLREQKILFAMYASYDLDPDEERRRKIVENVLTSETSLFFLVAQDGAKANLRQLAYDSRLRQNYPFVEVDYYGDAEAIGKIVAEHQSLLEIDSDGTILRPACGGTGFDFGIPLMEELRNIMPAWKAAGR